MKHPLSEHPRTTIMHLVKSYFENKPDLNHPCHTIRNELTSDDLVIAERLLAAFTKAHSDEQSVPAHRPMEGLWELMKDQCHGDAYKVLLNNDVPGVAELLTNALRTAWSQGIGMRVRSPDYLVEPGEAKDVYVLYAKDRLVSLAVALGVLPLENPEQGAYGKNIHQPIDDLISLIETKVKLVSRPPFMGVVGLLAKGTQIIDVRLPEDVYAAYRVGEFTGVHHIAEIGGGFGGTAHRFVTSGLQASIFDLPVINVLQGYFLIKALGGDKVKLYGEATDDRSANVLPWWSFYDRTRLFDMVFNRDSMAEIPAPGATNYLSEIIRGRCRFYPSIRRPKRRPGKTG